MEKRSLKSNQSEATDVMDSLESSNTSSNGRATLKATTLGKTPINVTICNHAYQKLFPFIITRPSSLLSLPLTRIYNWHVVKLHNSRSSINDRYVVKLQSLEPSPIVRYDVKLHLPSLGPDARYGAKLQLRTSWPSRPSWSPRQYW
jgi:hypothetical protein